MRETTKPREQTIQKNSKQTKPNMNKRSKQLKTKYQNPKQRDRTNLSKSTMKAGEKHIKNQNPNQSFSKGRKYIGGNRKLEITRLERKCKVRERKKFGKDESKQEEEDNMGTQNPKRPQYRWKTEEETQKKKRIGNPNDTTRKKR